MVKRRFVKNGANDIHTIYRPYLLEEFIGANINKSIISKGLDSGNLSHSLLFIGEPGCGKTTFARIISLGLNCETNGMSSTPCLKCKTCLSIMEQECPDVLEINVGQSGTKGDVDSIVKDLGYAPFEAKNKVIIFDECHKLTDAAVDLLLKQLEDGYDYVYFIFCTNHPEKILKNKAFASRFNILKFSKVKESQIIELLSNVCEYEGITYDINVLKLIHDYSEGIPRAALTYLKNIIDEGSWTIESANKLLSGFSYEGDEEFIQLCRSIMNKDWKGSIKIFDSLKTTTQIETLRITIMSYFGSCLKRFIKLEDGYFYSHVMGCFSEPIYENGKLAEHKFINCLFKTINQR